MQKMFSLTPTVSRFTDLLRRGMLPLFLAIYPALFHYGNNVRIVTLASLERALFLYSFIALVLYAAILVLWRGKALQASNATFILLVFFHIYGAVYNYLYMQEIIPVQDFTFLPLVVLIAFYAVFLLSKIDPARFWKFSIFLLGGLIASNLLRIVPAEASKLAGSSQTNVVTSTPANPKANSDYPDIYFILFDEFAGFESMRNYWNYQGVDEFASFLRSRGFFVAERSHSSSIYTLEQMTERLNYQDYPSTKEQVDIYYEPIINNRVMQYLKSLGYTTVVFDEKRFGYPAIPTMTADYSFEFDTDKDPRLTTEVDSLFDEFGILVAENTMLRAFPLYKSIDPMFEKHKEMIYFSAAKIADLPEVPAPKFVHVHLLLPHYPFMFSENGTINDPIHYYNWNYYLGNYKFTIRLAERMVTDILRNSNPDRPPIIILQSDHGARNVLVAARNGVQLKDFPEEYKTDILNAVYLPGYDTSQLPQDLNPINTFPIIFNHYFDANLPLVK